MITRTEAEFQWDAGTLRASYGVSFVNICEKVDRVIKAPQCTQKLGQITGPGYVLTHKTEYCRQNYLDFWPTTTLNPSKVV